MGGPQADSWSSIWSFGDFLSAAEGLLIKPLHFGQTLIILFATKWPHCGRPDRALGLLWTAGEDDDVSAYRPGPYADTTGDIRNCKRFSLASFHDQRSVDEYIELFSLRNLCRELEIDRAVSTRSEIERNVSPFERKPFAPEYADSCRLHWIALSRKVINVLEFVTVPVRRFLHENRMRTSVMQVK
jgi:hypothetical protein